ncbi:MAG: hypothetical protein OXF64_01075, partial [bacterium]|nr:hypothetical protein [bacterium]
MSETGFAVLGSHSWSGGCPGVVLKVFVTWADDCRDRQQACECGPQGARRAPRAAEMPALPQHRGR